MKEFEIWSEGYAATGEHSEARFHGKMKAESFIQACIKFFGNKLDINKDGSMRYTYPSIWGCRLYDNETDARKSFG